MGCGSAEKDSGRTVVVVSIQPYSYFVSRIAGNLVDIQVMLPPGANPATYEPTMQQMMSIASASLYVKVGHDHFPFEHVWLDKLMSDYPQIKMVEGPGTCQKSQYDPHLWLSPVHARVIASNISAALVELMPEHTAVFEANLTKLQVDIDTLDRELTALFAKVPTRRFYVFHPAWSHLAENYNLEQVAIEHGHKEPSTAELAHVIEQAKSDGAKVVFVQSQMSHASAEVVTSEIGGKIVQLDPLGADWLKNTRNAGKQIAKALER